MTSLFRLPRRGARGGFSLLEMLTVVVVVAILAGLALVRFASVQEKSYLATLQSDLRNYATAQAIYVSENDAFAPRPAALAGFALSEHVSPLIATADGASEWRLVVGHSKSQWRCALRGGPAATGVEAQSPVCAQGEAVVFEVSNEAPKAGTEVEFNATQAIAELAFGVEGGWGAALAVPMSEIARVSWSFGDGGMDSGAPETHSIVRHRYERPGEYRATLTLTRKDGRLAGGSKVIRAHNEEPVAAFSFAVTELTVSVDASGSSDADGDALTYRWSWGDGAETPASSSPAATHSYPKGGSYEVTLVVSDGKGVAKSLAKTVTIDLAPTASFSYAPLAPEGGDEVTFDASASRDPEGQPLSYAWDFGFIGSASGAVVQQALPAGSHLVALTVRDVSGQSVNQIQEVVVAVSPAPSVLEPGDQSARLAGSEEVRSWQVKNESNQARQLTLVLERSGAIESAVFEGTGVTELSQTFQAGETRTIQTRDRVSSSATGGSSGTVKLAAINISSSASSSRLYTVTVATTLASPSLVAPSAQSGNPGETRSVSFTLTNRSNVSRSFALQTMTSNQAVVSDPADPANVTLNAGAEVAIPVSYTVAADAAAGSTAEVSLKATDTGDATYTAQAGFVHTTATVLASPTVTAPANTTLNAGETKTASFTVKNNTNASRTFSFVASSSNTGVVSDPADPASQSIAAGGTVTVSFSYTAPSSTTGGSSTVSLKATDTGDATLTHTAGFGASIALASPTVSWAASSKTNPIGSSTDNTVTVKNNSTTSRTFCFVLEYDAGNVAHTWVFDAVQVPGCKTIAAGATENYGVLYNIPSNSQSGYYAFARIKAYDQDNTSLQSPYSSFRQNVQ